MIFNSIVLVAWIPFCALFFGIFRPVRAMTLAYLFGWLALPVFQISVQGFWDIDKVLATNMGVVLGALLFCPSRLKGYRLGWPDLALAVFASVALVTSLLNGLGLRDGVSSMTHKLFYYAVPFWLGRGFIRDRRDFLEASRLVVTGAAIYALLAIWEWRMSPQIHTVVYGVFQHS